MSEKKNKRDVMLDILYKKGVGYVQFLKINSFCGRAFKYSFTLAIPLNISLLTFVLTTMPFS